MSYANVKAFLTKIAGIASITVGITALILLATSLMNGDRLSPDGLSWFLGAISLFIVGATGVPRGWLLTCAIVTAANGALVFAIGYSTSGTPGGVDLGAAFIVGSAAFAIALITWLLHRAIAVRRRVASIAPTATSKVGH